MGLKRVLLSEAANGAPIDIVATSSAGDLIHTSPVGVRTIDEVHLSINNNSASAEIVHLEFSSGSNTVSYNVAATSGIGLVFCINGGETIRIFANTTGNIIEVSGWVNRIGEV